MNILFIGASGMLGKPVARELLSSGFNLSLLARDEDKMRKLFPNTRIIKGDVFDKTSLAEAMKGIDTVYLNLSITQSSGKKQQQPERDGIPNIIEAAKAAGVKRIAYLSSLIKNYQGMNGFNWWAFDIKHEAVKRIKESGISFSIFYPSTFMETADQQMMQGNKLMLAGRSEYPMWFIAAADYGKQVARALSIAGNNNQEYAIQGTEAYTFEEAAAIFRKHYKHPLKLMKAPIWLMKFLGLFSQKMNYAARICEALNKYPEQFESDKAWAELGKPSITLSAYAASLK